MYPIRPVVCMDKFVSREREGCETSLSACSRYVTFVQVSDTQVVASGTVQLVIDRGGAPSVDRESISRPPCNVY
jgi:hypothetical protein